jgi:hypothetical protein
MVIRFPKDCANSSYALARLLNARAAAEEVVAGIGDIYVREPLSTRYLAIQNQTKKDEFLVCLHLNGRAG